MNPRSVFCPQPDCPFAGQTEAGNVVIHSQKEQRYRCKACRRTFSSRQGTLFYRKKTPMEVVTVVLTLLAYGCPIQAIVRAFGLDERTVAAWLSEAGSHCQALHERLVQAGRIELAHVQADEMWVKRVGGKLWLAMALCVPSRLWLGGIVSETRDRSLAQALVRLIRSCGRSLSLLVCTDGWKPYKAAFFRGFRFSVRSGQRGRPRLLLEEGFRMGQVVKQYEKRRLTGVAHRILRGTQETIQSVLKATNGGTGINTAFIERLNATFRSRLAPLARRSRSLSRKTATLQAGMFLVGTVYNFCAAHDTLRQETNEGKWERTPAMASGLTDHCWTPLELFSYQQPPVVPPLKKRRGRPPKTLTNQLVAHHT